jgi:hypothetical protein
LASLDAERTLASAEAALATIRSQIAQDQVSLFLSLGRSEAENREAASNPKSPPSQIIPASLFDGNQAQNRADHGPRPEMGNRRHPTADSQIERRRDVRRWLVLFGGI